MRIHLRTSPCWSPLQHGVWDSLEAIRQISPAGSRIPTKLTPPPLLAYMPTRHFNEVLLHWGQAVAEPTPLVLGTSWGVSGTTPSHPPLLVFQPLQLSYGSYSQPGCRSPVRVGLQHVLNQLFGSSQSSACRSSVPSSFRVEAWAFHQHVLGVFHLPRACGAEGRSTASNSGYVAPEATVARQQLRQVVIDAAVGLRHPVPDVGDKPVCPPAF